MRIVSGSAHSTLALEIATILCVPFVSSDVHVFPDGEKRVAINEKIVGENVVVVQPTSPPVDANCMELFFLLDAVKRSGAASICAVIPYIGYQRQDHVFVSGEAVSLSVVIKILESLGIDRVVCCDLHSIKIPELFTTTSLSHLSALPLFAALIKKNKWMEGSVLVSPDMGGIRRIKQLSFLLGDMPWASVEKNRDLATGMVSATMLHGTIGKRVLIVDDMISSGKTIETASLLLKEKGAQELYVFATHPVFSDEACSILQNAPVEKVFVANTIAVPKEKQFGKLEILSIAPLIAEELVRIATSD